MTVDSHLVPRVAVRRLAHAAELPPPTYMSDAAAGADLCAAQALHLAPGERSLVPTGFAIELPRGFEAQIRPRSGLALRSGITCLNAPGTIDADYRGEICVLLINHGSESVAIARGERIAQLVVTPVARANFELVDELGATARGENGFGSTGRNASVRS